MTKQGLPTAVPFGSERLLEDTTVHDVVFDNDFASARVDPTYDDNDLLIFEGIYKNKHDAWNHPVEVKNGQRAESVVATYTYAGTGQQTSKKGGATPPRNNCTEVASPSSADGTAERRDRPSRTYG